MADLTQRLRVVCATASRSLHEEISAALGPPVSRPFLVGGACEPELSLRSRLGGGYIVESATHGAEPAWLVLGARRQTQPVAVVILDGSLNGSRGLESSLRGIWTADPHVEVVLLAAPEDAIPRGIVREADEGGQVVVLRTPVQPVDLVLAVGSAAGRWSLREQLADAGRGSFAVKSALRMFRPDPVSASAAAGLGQLGLTLDEPTTRILDSVQLMRDALDSYAAAAAQYRRLLATACAQRPDLRAEVHAIEAAADLPWLEQHSESLVDSVSDAVDYVRTTAEALRLLATQAAAGVGYSDVNASIHAAVQDVRGGPEARVEILTDLREIPPAHCPVSDLRGLLRDAIARTAQSAATRGGRRVVITTRRNSCEVLVEIGSEPSDTTLSPVQSATPRARPIRIRLPIEPTTSWST
jgi:hypothetical protein